MREDVGLADRADNAERRRALRFGPLHGFVHGQRAGAVRELPQPGEQARFGAAADGAGLPAAQQKHSARLHALFRLRQLHGKMQRAARRLRRADATHWAARAVRVLRRADAGPELHQRLCEHPAVSRGIDRLQPRGDLPPDRGQVDRARLGRDARDDAQDVAVHRGARPFKADRRDGAGRVRADPRQLLQLRRRIREAPAARLDEQLRRLLQVARAGIVAEALPKLEDSAFLCGGERLHIRERLHKPVVIADDGFDARLLEHDLRDPHAVRLAAAPPGQVARVFPVPRQQAHGQRRINFVQISHIVFQSNSIICVRRAGGQKKGGESFRLPPPLSIILR